MRFIFASDSFKGSLTSEQTALLLTRAAREIFGASAGCVSVPAADGGEGTVDAVIRGVHGEIRTARVKDPLMREITARYGLMHRTEAVLEMAAASGLPLLSARERDPMLTTTYGTGELIRTALDSGATKLYIAIGGSATNDGGMGCMRALGVRFLNENGSELSGRGRDLSLVSSIDRSGLDPRLADGSVSVTVMCDVTNPLCGERGATFTYGTQKGASAEKLQQLEEGMLNYKEVLEREIGRSVGDIPGSGAAGGLGAALLAFLSAEMRSGIETVLELLRFDELLEGADYVITGEGRCDAQSSFGKVLSGVGRHARDHRIPAVALVGSLGDGHESVLDCGIRTIMPAADRSMSSEEAMRNAEELYYKAALRLFRMIREGRLPEGIVE